MIKLIAVDMDGTLLNSARELPAENILALQRAAQAGVKIVLCTGRPKSGVQPYFNKLELTEEEYVIMNNGCSVYNTKEWDLIDYSALSYRELEILEQAVLDCPDVCLTLTGERTYYALGKKVPELVQADAELVFTTARAASLDQVRSDSEIIFQAMYMAEKAQLDRFQKIRETELGQLFSAVRSQNDIFEAMPKGVTKGKALQALSNQLGFNAGEVMAIGDAANDLEMLKFAGVSVAMANASQQVKEHSRYLTVSNDEAGVARAIDKYVFS
ncbi:HAD family phosphatase [Streptococcus chenjunshii]|uniref:HAD family phosphatase n=1 Tax=Streptococcus chenjunshii TaxID=2173853 RepID=A0A372KM15_9STRE|nr:Cof-type HAD-IIB family hydrolase [Streptococcus chenjunshii]AXQ79291.1 HAD family phosphatase [Streptococcus chenjunshii]RFU50870.1 HAD family phosphatase [Streptococcus chenjunshii]RFU53016.1 HAD family phosphatase [Streptococcus chenjunshii]